MRPKLGCISRHGLGIRGAPQVGLHFAAWVGNLCSTQVGRVVCGAGQGVRVSAAYARGSACCVGDPGDERGGGGRPWWLGARRVGGGFREHGWVALGGLQLKESY